MEPYILTAEDIARLSEQGFDTRGISAGAEAMPEEITALGIGQPAPQPTVPTAPDASMAAASGMPISMVGADGTVTAEPVGAGGIIAPPAAAPQAPTMPTTVNPNMALLAGGMPTVAGGGFMGGALGGSIEPQSTDPFEGLSRNQRMMLGFAALRDAAASLEGRDTSFFNDQLGIYEGARERERLRVQGATQNRIQGLQALAQVQQQIAFLRGMNLDVPPSLLQLEAALSGTAAPQAAPAPQPMAEATPQPQPDGQPQPVATETPAMSDFDTRLAAIDDAEQMILDEMRQRTLAAAASGQPAMVDDLNARSEALEAERQRIIDERDAADAEAAASARQTQTENRMRPLVEGALNFLLDSDGNIRENTALIANVSAFGAGLLPGVSAADARKARSAIEELAAIAGMSGVAEARAAGFGGSLSDADILMIQRSQGIFDLSNPEATVETLRRLQSQFSENGGDGETVTLSDGTQVRIRERQ